MVWARMEGLLWWQEQSSIDSPGSVCLGWCSAYKTGPFLFYQLLFWPKPPPPSMLDVFFRALPMFTSNLGSLWLLSALHCQAKSTPSSADSHPQCHEEVSIVPISGFNFSGASSLDRIVAGLLDLNAHLSRPSFDYRMSLLQHWPGLPTLLLDFGEQCRPVFSCASLIFPPRGSPSQCLSPHGQVLPVQCLHPGAHLLHQQTIDLQSLFCEEAFPALSRPQGSPLASVSVELTNISFGGDPTWKMSFLIWSPACLFSPWQEKDLF